MGWAPRNKSTYVEPEDDIEDQIESNRDGECLDPDCDCDIEEN